MEPISKNISEFINNNKIATLCFTDTEGNPYCINCFYAFDETTQSLILKSSVGTKHQNFIKAKTKIAGTILPKTIDLLKIKGLQFTGNLLEEKQINDLSLSLIYIKKFPFSLAIPGYIWAVNLEYLKFTDNTTGFGKKTIWQVKH